MTWGLTPSHFVTIALTIGWLVILEGLLSGDNALVLAVMVRHLPKPQQKRALLYGIWGAVLFRLIAVVSANFLLRFWQLKVFGGLYLIFLAARHFLSGHDDDDPATKEAFGRGFWGTVISVELADIAFSIDSILAAVAMVEGLPTELQERKVLALGIIYLGGILGIVMMRLIANFFIVILNRFKGLAAGAYILVAWIGLKLTGGGFNDAFHPKSIAGVVPPAPGWWKSVPDWVRGFPWELNNYAFWGGMIAIVLVSMLYRPGHSRSSHEG
jgi:YkoY family integral membrane protein